jgi:hypothetical protein
VDGLPKISAIDNKKVRMENAFVENKNLTAKTEIVSGTLLKQTYRLGQRVISHVGGWFADKSAICSKKERVEINKKKSVQK